MTKDIEDFKREYTSRVCLGLISMSFDDYLESEGYKEEMTNKLPVYKKVQKTDKFIQVGQVDEYGYLEFDVPTYESIGNGMPKTFYPEFYTDYETERVITGRETIRNAEGVEIGEKTVSVGRYIASIDKKVFTPKNMPTQLVSLSGSTFLEPKDYYVTGYVDKDGMAVYYDQFIEG